jgi:hypothetical protein
LGVSLSYLTDKTGIDKITNIIAEFNIVIFCLNIN